MSMPVLIQRLQVHAAGFTIAPLMPAFTKGGVSTECLVTLVLKVDLGGEICLPTRGIQPLLLTAEHELSPVPDLALATDASNIYMGTSGSDIAAA